jgi:outer membrane receptor protein involved in Fe transport
MRYLILFVSLVFALSDLRAQITGRLVDATTQEPVAGAAVSLLDTAGKRIAATSSRVNGEFRFKAFAHTLRIKHQGYRDTTVALMFNDVVIELTPSYLSGGEITVTANRVATAVQDLAVSTVVARAAEIQGRSPQGLDNILRAVPGVTVTESQVSIRGSSGYARAVGSRVLLLMDGMPFLSGDNGDMKFDAIPFPAVDRVEIIKGAGSALYGSNAIGGVINVLTRDPREEWKGGVAVTAGQYDAPKYDEWKMPELTGRFYNLDAGLENKWDDFGALLTASYRKNEGYRFGDDLERYNIFGKGIYSSSPELTLRASTLIANDAHGGWLYWRGLAKPYMDADSLTALKDRTNSNRVNINLGADYAFDEKSDKLWISKASFYTTEYVTDGVPEQDEEGSQSRANVLSVESFVNFDANFDSPDTSRDFAKFMRSTFGTFFDLVGFNTTVGVNANHYDVRSTTLSNQTAYGLAGFAQLEIKYFGGLSFLPGLRFDHFKANHVNSEQQFSPKYGFNYRPFEELSIRISKGSGFRVPTLTERFINSKMAGFTIIPNDSLRPERSKSNEIGVTYRDRVFTLDGAVFTADYEDMIEPQFVGDKIQFNNITRAKQFGHEEFVEVRPFGSELLKARVGYTYVYSEDLSSRQVLPYRPRHLLQARAEWQPGAFELSSDFRYISAYESTDSTLASLVKDGDVRNSAYVLDARASVDLKSLAALPLKLTLQVQNLLNYYYVELVGNMGPLRSYSLKLETRL